MGNCKSKKKAENESLPDIVIKEKEVNSENDFDDLSKESVPIFRKAITIPFLKEIANSLRITIRGITRKDEIFLTILKKINNQRAHAMLNALTEDSLQIFKGKVRYVEDDSSLSRDNRIDKIINHLNSGNITKFSASSGRKSIGKNMRRLIWDKWCGETRICKCYCCGVTTMDCMASDWHVGHVKSVAEGGETSVENTRPICASCNLDMKEENMLNYAKRLHLSGSILREIDGKVT